MYSNTTSIGLMDEAYFVPKKDLLQWIWDVIGLSVECIEDLGSGSVYCQLLDANFGQRVPMSKVNWKAKFEYEWINNLKIFQQTMDRVGISKKIDIEKLAKAKYQDNLEMIQWLKRYSELNGNFNRETYHAAERRSHATLYSITQKKKALNTSFKTNPVASSNSCTERAPLGQSNFMNMSVCSTTSQKPTIASICSATNKSFVKRDTAMFKKSKGGRENKQNQLNEHRVRKGSKVNSSNQLLQELTQKMDDIKKVLSCAENAETKLSDIGKVVFGLGSEGSSMEIESINNDSQMQVEVAIGEEEDDDVI